MPSVIDALLSQVQDHSGSATSTLGAVRAELDTLEESFDYAYDLADIDTFDLEAALAIPSDPTIILPTAYDPDPTYSPSSPTLQPLAIDDGLDPALVGLDELEGPSPDDSVSVIIGQSLLHQPLRDPVPSRSALDTLHDILGKRVFSRMEFDEGGDLSSFREAQLPEFAQLNDFLAPPMGQDDDGFSVLSGYHGASLAGSSELSVEHVRSAILETYERVQGKYKRRRARKQMYQEAGVAPPTVSAGHEAMFERGRRARIYNLADIPLHMWPSRTNTKSRALKRWNKYSDEKKMALEYSATAMEEFYSHFRMISRHGVAPFKHASGALKPEDFVTLSPSFSQYLAQNPIPGFNPANYCFMKPSRAVMHKHLQRFSRIHRRQMPDVHTNIVRHAKAHMVEMFAPFEGKVKAPQLSDLADVEYDPSRHPGFYYSSAPFHFKTRRESYPYALKDAEKFFTELAAGRFPESRPFLVGGRGKGMKISMEEAIEKSEPAGRMILMADDATHKLLGAYLNPITKEVLSMIPEFSIGKSHVHGGTAADAADLEYGEFWASSDATKFDSSIEPDMARMAIDSLLGCIDWSDSPISRSTMSDYIFETLIETVIAFPEGVIMKKFCGTASGHNWNSPVQSWITVFSGAVYVLARMNVPRQEEIRRISNIKGMGDDNRTVLFSPASIGFNPWSKRTHLEACAIVKEVGNVDWVSKKSHTGKELGLYGHSPRIFNPERYEGVMEYLSRYILQATYPSRSAGAIIVSERDPLDNLLALAYPEKRGKERYFALKDGEIESLEYTYARACGHLVDNGGHLKFRRWLEGYLDFLEEKGVNPGSIPVSEKFLRMSERLGLGDHYQNLVLKRSKLNEWLSLMLDARTVETDMTDENQALLEAMGVARKRGRPTKMLLNSRTPAGRRAALNTILDKLTRGDIEGVKMAVGGGGGEADLLADMGLD